MQTQFAELMQQQKNENKDESSKNSEQQEPSTTFEKEEPSEVTEMKEKKEDDDSENKHVISNKTITQTPKNINKFVLAKQLREKLNDIQVDLPANLDALILNAVSTSKKDLNNEAAFYKILLDNNLHSLVKNKSKFNRYIKPHFFHI